MKTHHKVVLGVMALLVVAAICALVDRWANRAAQSASVLDSQYQEMTYAMVQGQAGEQPTNHPMYVLYQERKDALIKAGYLKTREFPMRRGFESRTASRSFFTRFAKRFPGVGVQIRFNQKSGEPPVITVCAKDSDLPAIKWFIMQEDKGQ